jgi:tetratricopeptide (TPR) repeat protein
VADPCAGRKATNPFDECLRIDIKDRKSVSTASPDPGMVHNPAQVQALPEAGPTPRAGKQRVVWQSEPSVGFVPATSEDGRTRVTYSRMGQVKLWCEIQEMIEGAYHTVGECDQETVEVIAPKFSVSFTPAEGQGRIGQDIRLRVDSEPSVPDDLIDFRWFDPATSNRLELTPNAREIGFRVKDAKPVVFKALARVPHHGDEIADIAATYTGVAYEVKIGEPKGYGPPLQVWVCDTQLGNAQNCGMKPILQGQFATFQDIFLKSEVTPAPPSPHYRWSVEPSGACGLPGSGSELRLNCSNTGSYTVRLQVFDSGNILLGQAERTLSVSVSDNDVKQAPKSKEAWEKMQQAKQQANAGRLDEAITLAGSAAGLDPRNTEAKDLGTRWANERNTVRQQLEQARKALQANKSDEAQKQLEAAKKLHPKYPPVLEIEKQIADTRKGRDVAGGLQVDTTPAGTIATAGSSRPVSLAGVGGEQGTPRTVKGVTIDDSSWIRFKSTDENRRSLDIPVPTPTRAAAVAIVSNLDDATYLEQGRTIARIVVVKDTGDEILEIQAGVHSSEWNYGVGPKHQRVNSADIGDNRFLVVLPLARPGVVKGLRVEYVETGAPKWAGHAPGFVLRGISLVTDTKGLTLTPATGTEIAVSKPAGAPRVSELTWLGMDEDRVGEWGNGKPNGTRDGHFRLVLEAEGRFAIASLSVWSANERGEKTGGQVWHTKNGSYWMLGVFRDGRQLNTSHVPSLGELSGRVALDLYANSSGWFNPGQWFLLEMETVDGHFVRQSIRLGTVGMSQGGIVVSPGGRDYTGHESSSAAPVSQAGAGYLRIEACVDGSDWISLDNGRLDHQHHAFAQIGTHGSCPASHRVAGGGFLVDGLPVALSRLPMPVGMAGIGRFEVERGRGQVRMDGPNRILIDDPEPNADVYIIRVYPSATTTGTPPVAIVAGGRDYSAGPVQGQLIFEIGNIGGVGNGPSKSSQFTWSAPHVVTLIRTYHWNSARGAAPGSIALKGKDGGSHGPWQATGSPGQGGVPNAYWTVYPNVTLPAGTYTVIDSDPATWSHNAESSNRGFVRVEGYPADTIQSATSPSTGNTQVDSLMKEVDGLLDAVKSLKGLFGK